jgi:hypothetical protein
MVLVGGASAMVMWGHRHLQLVTLLSLGPLRPSPPKCGWENRGCGGLLQGVGDGLVVARNPGLALRAHGAPGLSGKQATGCQRGWNMQP